MIPQVNERRLAWASSKSKRDGIHRLARAGRSADWGAARNRSEDGAGFDQRGNDRCCTAVARIGGRDERRQNRRIDEPIEGGAKLALDGVRLPGRGIVPVIEVRDGGERESNREEREQSTHAPLGSSGQMEDVLQVRHRRQRRSRCTADLR